MTCWCCGRPGEEVIPGSGQYMCRPCCVTWVGPATAKEPAEGWVKWQAQHLAWTEGKLP